MSVPNSLLQVKIKTFFPLFFCVLFHLFSLLEKCLIKTIGLKGVWCLFVCFFFSTGHQTTWNNAVTLQWLWPTIRTMSRIKVVPPMHCLAFIFNKQTLKSQETDFHSTCQSRSNSFSSICFWDYPMLHNFFLTFSSFFTS